MQVFKREKDEDVKDIIGYLQGTCGSIDPSEFTDEELTYIFDNTFECDECGWWFAIHEEEVEGLCGDCSEDYQKEQEYLEMIHDCPPESR